MLKKVIKHKIGYILYILIIFSVYYNNCFASVILIDTSSLLLQNKDEIIRIEIYIKDVNNLAGFQFDLCFNKNALELISCEQGNIFDSSLRQIYTLHYQINNNVITYGIYSKGLYLGSNGSGTLAVLNFKAKTLTPSEMRISNFVLADSNIPVRRIMTDNLDSFIYLIPDINGDKRIGLEEAIYLIQLSAGIINNENFDCNLNYIIYILKIITEHEIF